MRSKFSVFLILFLGISFFILTGFGLKDEDIAPFALPKFTDYFPGTMIYEVDKRVLWIQTNVDGISESAAGLMFKQSCAQASMNFGKLKFNIHNELVLDGKQFLVIGFNHFWVLWSVRNGLDNQGVPLNYQVMDEQMFHNWLTQYLGYLPTSDQIRVITLQDAKEKPVQSHTLTEIQQQKSVATPFEVK